MNNIISIFDKCFPIESTKINYKNRNPWINQNLKNENQNQRKIVPFKQANPISKNKIKIIIRNIKM